jgi:hypothetical protein
LGTRDLIESNRSIFMQGLDRFAGFVPVFGAIVGRQRMIGETRAMKLAIEILAAVLLLVCVSASSAAFAAGERSADGLGCSFSVPPNASPAQRCAAIRKQCGGKFYANYCGDRLLSAE